jgi:hypothetical protein
MKRILLMLLMICLAKLAGAQIPKLIPYKGLPASYANQLVTNGSYSIASKLCDASSVGIALRKITQSLITSKDVFVAVSNGVNRAAAKVFTLRTGKLQSENKTLEAKAEALQHQADPDPNFKEQEATASKSLFIVCLLSGVLLMSLVSGRAFSKDTYTSRFAQSRR